ncbi:MAG TPA: hypothetical protein DCQ39_07750 [Lachnospiraceae bacterium]|nr:hypothetical protein [Lachnospiraceae bacterium]HAP73656.1 hypothetical protein [Lachnospiraceae bacterium]
MSNARIEATNNKIKLIIRKAYGFRNIQNMLDMVYLICSDLRASTVKREGLHLVLQLRISLSNNALI